ncbi:MAG: tetratricopeptide repeat protein [Gemmatimonadaceae bacterium]|nr:tetratricopeptide repeat protein [Gemmatimonadaceae bacterium]
MQSSPRIDELRQKFHENPRRYFAPLANEYRKAGDPEQAIAICRAHLAQQPAHMSGHVVYGQALYDARRVEEARSVFEKALALDPDNSIVLKQLGDIARHRGDSSEAQHWYKRALDADPHAPDVAAYVEELRDAEVGAADVSSEVATTVAANTEQSAAESIDGDELDAARALAARDEQQSGMPETAARNAGDAGPETGYGFDADNEQSEAQEGETRQAEEQQPEEQRVEAQQTSDNLKKRSTDGPEAETAAEENLTTEELMEGQPSAVGVPADEQPAAEQPTEAQLVNERTATEQGAVDDANAQSAGESMPLIDFDIAEKPFEQLEPVPSTSSAGFDELSIDESLQLTGDDSPKADMEIAVAGPMDQAVSVIGEPGFEVAPDAAVTDVTRNRTPSREESPFVTRTMGELYAQQGYHAAALEVFRQLALQNPDDSAIADRIEEITRLVSRRTPPKPRSDEPETGLSTPESASEATSVMPTGDFGEGSMDEPEDRPDPGSASIIDWDEPSSIYAPPAADDASLSANSMDAGAVERHFGEMEIGDGDAWDTDPWAAGFSPEDRSAFSSSPRDVTGVNDPSDEQPPDDNRSVEDPAIVETTSETASTDTTPDEIASDSTTAAGDASAGESLVDEESAFASGEGEIASPGETQTETVPVPETEDGASLVAYSPSAPSDDELTHRGSRAPSVRELFATLGSWRAPLREGAGAIETRAPDSKTAPLSERGSRLSEPSPETTFPLATDAFADLFPDAFVAESDTRAAFALSGAVSSVPPEVATPAGPVPGRRSDQPSGATASGESEEDIRRFREWLDGLSES